MRTLDLDKLREGLPGITPTYGAFLAEAAIVCLNTMGHQTGVRFQVTGDFKEDFELCWSEEPSQQDAASTWGDMRESVEYGAMGIAILTVAAVTQYGAFEKKAQGQGEDYWAKMLKTVHLLKQPFKIGLEISGILKEQKGNTIPMRVSIKKQQVKKADHKQPSLIAIVEFGTPKTKIVKK